METHRRDLLYSQGTMNDVGEYWEVTCAVSSKPRSNMRGSEVTCAVDFFNCFRIGRPTSKTFPPRKLLKGGVDFISGDDGNLPDSMS